MSGWGVFAGVIGSATAALLGLLFVAVSFRVDTVAKSAELRNRTAQTLTLLLTGLLIAVLLSVPDQRTWALGAEYLVMAFVVTGFAISRDRRAGTGPSSKIGHSLAAINPTYVTCILVAIAGISLILGHTDGLYALVPALIAVLGGGVINAWLILIKL
jgi:hypothetical protein